MNEDMVIKYNEFLKSKGFVLSRDKTDYIMHRSTTPVILNAMADISKEQVHNILEIGRNNGYSFGFLRFCFPNAKVVSIDIYRTKTAVKVADMFDKNYLFIDGTSDRLKEHNTIFDIVFIDGCHTYDWCKKDWENIQKNISNNSVVFFDDLDYRGDGVQKFFDSIDKKKFIKFIDNNPMYGVVYMNEQ